MAFTARLSHISAVILPFSMHTGPDVMFAVVLGYCRIRVRVSVETLGCRASHVSKALCESFLRLEKNCEIKEDKMFCLLHCGHVTISATDK